VVSWVCICSCHCLLHSPMAPHLSDPSQGHISSQISALQRCFSIPTQLQLIHILTSFSITPSSFIFLIKQQWNFLSHHCNVSTMRTRLFYQFTIFQEFKLKTTSSGAP
jgi:hypothetical protein